MIAVLDYGIGNLRSAEKALVHVGADARLVTSAAEATGAAGVVLPGVGAFGPCVDALRLSGLDEVALAAIADGTPFLGVCVGMQLLYERSEETPGARGLGVLPGPVTMLAPGVKRPQMQWNVVDASRPQHQLFEGLGEQPWFYFVHSYAPQWSDDAGDVIGTCDYGGTVVAAVARDNVWATQFHPEKSGAAGLRLLANFVAACT